MKELWEYKLDLLYYGIQLSKKVYDLLRKSDDGKVNYDDYITTKGLFIILGNKAYVSPDIDESSPYSLEINNKYKYFLAYKGEFICYIEIIQPPAYALSNLRIKNGKLITDLVNVHGDRIRIQPIMGCANRCSFCDLNKSKYYLMPLSDLDEAYSYARATANFKHALISGGTPLNKQEDYDYLNDVYRYFGEKYGKSLDIDVMLVPRGLNVNDNSDNAYEEFLYKLKEWNISGLAINLELYNNELRKKYVPQKDLVGKENYFKFIELAVKIFGIGNVRSCIIIGLESIEDSLKAVDKLCSLGCMPVLSPYIPNDNESHKPTPEFMREVLLSAKEIADKYNMELGPKCDSCKHNTIHFR